MPATLTIDLNVVLTVCSLVAIIVVWIQATRGTARMEGRHQKELEVMRDRLQHIESDMDADISRVVEDLIDEIAKDFDDRGKTLFIDPSKYAIKAEKIALRAELKTL